MFKSVATFKLSKLQVGLWGKYFDLLNVKAQTENSDAHCT
jgi:hypothetical protein